MKLSRRRVGAILRKELREYRRTRSVVVAMAILPLVFTIQPVAAVLVAPASAADVLGRLHVLLYMLGIPVLVGPTLAAYAVAGERQQETLEPVLESPIRREEFLLGKALAAFVPAVLIAYAIYAAFIVFAVLFAQPGIAAALIRWPDVLAQVVFTPLLAALTIWIGIAISTRSGDVRVAQQLSVLGSLPAVLVTSLIGFDAIPASLPLGLLLGAGLLVADISGYRLVARLFDRERLISGTRSS
jgi:ABC-type Na+ efflux pump permease subunit